MSAASAPVQCWHPATVTRWTVYISGQRRQRVHGVSGHCRADGARCRGRGGSNAPEGAVQGAAADCGDLPGSHSVLTDKVRGYLPQLYCTTPGCCAVQITRLIPPAASAFLLVWGTNHEGCSTRCRPATGIDAFCHKPAQSYECVYLQLYYILHASFIPFCM